ncbi:Type II secretory pathway, component PulK [endosymbiont of Ridgeia piscesae]|uniref:General secretion pathway protein K n=2 Tax=endosymbiont of Ridgeia piscesae TaxID=54398 RepID=A0A0T5YZ16_9GAMM|nr:Type II secretory pathway, component PulK [endosymbiont of Ridgeia piscesae]KRT57762.1 general secretion pathway protein K [endosymbiont of Ridgeia piscesae]
MHRAGKGERGIALLLVLWLIVLLSVIGGSHARNGRMELNLAANQREALQARLHAEAGLYMAIDDLLVSSREGGFQLRGVENQVEFEGTRLTVSIINATGLTDINQATSSTLEALIVSTGMKKEQARSLVDAILDWRDADDLIRLQGAEARQYAAAGLAYRPANARFKSEQELKMVLGMTAETYRAIVPFITVHSKGGALDSAQAPAALLRQLEQQEAAVMRGSAGRQIDRPQVPGSLPRQLPAYPIYHLDVRAVTGQGGRSHVRAVVDISGNLQRRYRILAWRELAGDQEVKDG